MWGASRSNVPSARLGLGLGLKAVAVLHVDDRFTQYWQYLYRWVSLPIILAIQEVFSVEGRRQLPFVDLLKTTFANSRSFAVILRGEGELSTGLDNVSCEICQIDSDKLNSERPHYLFVKPRLTPNSFHKPGNRSWSSI